MSNIASKLERSLGLENVAEVPVAEADNFDEFGAPIDSVLSDGTPTPEADVVDLEIVYDEAHTGAEELEELAEAAQGIESIYNAMVEANANGGMTPQAAKYAAIALEAYGVKHGISGNEMMGSVSLESFEANQVQATTVSMEGVADTLKSWWAVIVQKFKELMAKINKYFQENGAAAGRLKKRAEAIKAKARKTNGNKDKNDLEDKGLWRALNIKGGNVEFSALTKGLKDGAVAARAAVTPDNLDTKIENDFFKKVEGDQPLAQLNANASKIKSFMQDLVNLTPTSASLAGIKIGGTEAQTLSDIKGITELPGNKAILWGYTKNLGGETTSPAQILSSFVYKVETQNSDAKEPSTPKVPALTASEVETLCDIVIDNMSQIIRNKTNSDNHLKLVKSIKKGGDDYISKLNNDDNNVQKRAEQLLQGSVRIAKEVRAGNAAVLRYNMKTSKAVLSYCSKSLSNLKK